MKAVRVSSKHPEAMVIGADSTLACNGRLFDKPPTMDAARKQLMALRGQTHELFSSVVVARGGARLWHWTERARLTMRSFNEAFLDAYLARAGKDVLTSVGAYQLEGLGAHLFTPRRRRLFHHPRPAAAAAAVVPGRPRHRPGEGGMSALRGPAGRGARPAVRGDRRLAGRAFALARAARLLAEAARHRRLLRPPAGRAASRRRSKALVDFLKAHAQRARLQSHPAAQDRHHAAARPHPSRCRADRRGEHGDQAARRQPRRPQQRWLRLPRRPASRARRNGRPRPGRSWCWARAAPPARWWRA